MRDQGLSQRELADAIGVSQSRISRWIGGGQGPQMDRIPLIAKVVGLTEAEVAALVWQARKEPNRAALTYGERLSALEGELADMREQMQRVVALLDQPKVKSRGR
jgi:transcriptional regulator with XRE-family HTH domain